MKPAHTVCTLLPLLSGCDDLPELPRQLPGSPPRVPLVEPDAPSGVPRLPALGDLTFAAHDFDIPWAQPPLSLTLYLPHNSTRGPELALDVERSLRILTERWSGPACRSIQQLDIYIVDARVMADETRFDVGPRLPGRELWGVYSPDGGTYGTAAIAVRDFDPERTAVVLGHELAHYWHDRLCMSGDTEEFAQAYEAIDWPHAEVSRPTHTSTIRFDRDLGPPPERTTAPPESRRDRRKRRRRRRR